jgi:hypothetical protein
VPSPRFAKESYMASVVASQDIIPDISFIKHNHLKLNKFIVNSNSKTFKKKRNISSFNV